MKFLLLFLLPVFLVSCSGKEKKEIKSPLEVLNGANYGHTGDPVYGNEQGVTNMVQGIPVSGSKNRTTRIHGRISTGEGLNAAPVKFTQVRVTDAQGKELAQATSDINGKFSMAGVFFNGRYFVEVVSKKYKAKTQVLVDRYDIDLELTATPL
ncbi:MAG: carboxypeptidase regulatory-like domain-containing protein [Bdellovibrio sp.]|nr:carboxypeptidase regulatory-like domain-containing protein [Bdellovibrio sp.]